MYGFRLIPNDTRTKRDRVSNTLMTKDRGIVAFREESVSRTIFSGLAGLVLAAALVFWAFLA